MRHARAYDYDEDYEAPVVATPVRRDKSLGIFALAILLIIVFFTNRGSFPSLTDGSWFTNPFSTASTASVVATPQIVPPVSQFSNSRAGGLRVNASSLYVRPNPGFQYNPMYVLPQDTEVFLTGESHRDQYGEDWVKVQVRTSQGLQQGWVSGKYLRS